MAQSCTVSKRGMSAVRTDYPAHVIIVTTNNDLGGLLKSYLDKAGLETCQVGYDFNPCAVNSKGNDKIIIFDTGPFIEDNEAITRIHRICSESDLRLICLVPPFRPDAKLKCMATGADSIMEKPLNVQDLFRVLSKVLISCEHKTSFGGS